MLNIYLIYIYIKYISYIIISHSYTGLGDGGTSFRDGGTEGPQFGDGGRGREGGGDGAYIVYTIHMILKMLIMKRCVTI